MTSGFDGQVPRKALWIEDLHTPHYIEIFKYNIFVDYQTTDFSSLRSGKTKRWRCRSAKERNSDQHIGCYKTLKDWLGIGHSSIQIGTFNSA